MPRRSTRSRTNLTVHMNGRGSAPVDPLRRTRAAGPVQGLRLFLLRYQAPAAPDQSHLDPPKTRCPSGGVPGLSSRSSWSCLRGSAAFSDCTCVMLSRHF